MTNMTTDEAEQWMRDHYASWHYDFRVNRYIVRVPHPHPIGEPRATCVVLHHIETDTLPEAVDIAITALVAEALNR